MEANIEISNPHRRFGATVALDGMTFTVAPGEVTGFVGQNGPGKSTSMRMICGLGAPGAGSAPIGGLRCQRLRHTAAQVACLLRVPIVPS
jgi:ABC-2 type transport system ATP-binding protein